MTSLLQSRAHAAVAEAVQTGRLVRPTRCARCDSDAHRIEGHHADYAQPLNVEWLCVLCHRRLHAAARPPRPPRYLSTVRLDVADLEKWETLLALEYPAVNRSLEIRRLIHRDIAERENGSS